MGRLSGRNNNKYAVVLVLLIISLLFLTSLTGCASSSYLETRQEETADQAAPKYLVSSDSSVGNEAAKNTSPDYDEMAQTVPDNERKVIQNAGMVLAVSDASQVMDKIVKIGQDNQGYTVSSNFSRGDDWVRGEVNIKVPSARLSSVMDEIATLGEIKDKNITTQDVTEEYYDSQARLTVLGKKEERLLVLYNQAKTIEEIISVENELTRVRSDIEVLQGRLKYLENATSYSSISVSLNQAAPGTVEVPEGVWAKAVQAFINSVNGVASFLSGFFIFLIAFIPWAVLLALIIWGFRTLKRKYHWSFKRNKKNSTVPAAAEEDKRE